MIFRPVETFQCSTPERYISREPKSSFGENQLLPDSISLSLLTTRHPRVLHGSPVRASIRLSANFTLRVASSSGFGSQANNRRPVQTRFPYGSRLSPLARNMHQLVGSFFNRHAVEVLRPLLLLVNIWFQVYFIALTGLLFTFPSRY